MCRSAQLANITWTVSLAEGVRRLVSLAAAAPDRDPSKGLGADSGFTGLTSNSRRFDEPRLAWLVRGRTLSLRLGIWGV